MANSHTWLWVILMCSVASETSSLSVDLQILSKIFLPYTYSPPPLYSLGKDAAEQMAYDSNTRLLYSCGNTNLHVIDVSDVTNLQVLYHTSEENVDVTDIEICGDYVFVANDNLLDKENGYVDVYRKYDATTQRMDHLQRIPVGHLPDMIYPTKDCSRLFVALEAEPYDDHTNQRLVDNPGAVLIIKFNFAPDGSYSNKTLDFKRFDDRIAELELQGVRHIYKENNNPFSNDVEPEYIAFNKDETKAYVALQENNAIAVVNMLTEEIEDVYGLRFKDWRHLDLDTSDKDGGIHLLRQWKVYGMFQPDSIAVYRHQGEDYVITANEGDSKDYEFFSEEARVGKYGLSNKFEPNTNQRNFLEEDRNLGRLKVTKTHGFNEASQKFDSLYAFGGRSFSIFRAADMRLVYDSGADISLRTAFTMSSLFNGNANSAASVASTMDTRSDDKGPETESVALGDVNDDVTLVFIGNERPGTVMVFSINRTAPQVAPVFQTVLADIEGDLDQTWETMYNNSALSMIDCEDMTFVPAGESPNGEHLLLVTGSTSGTVTVVQVNVRGLEPTSRSTSGAASVVQVNVRGLEPATDDAAPKDFPIVDGAPIPVPAP